MWICVCLLGFCLLCQCLRGAAPEDNVCSTVSGISDADRWSCSARDVGEPGGVGR